MQHGAKTIRFVFLSSFLFFAQMAAVLYINSTVLNHLVGVTTTVTLFVLGAAGSITLLFFLPHIVQEKGLLKTSLVIFSFLVCSLIVLGTTHSTSIFAAVFVIYSALLTSIWYCNDMLITHYAHHAVMGRTRGMYLLVIDIATASMPIIAGFLIVKHGFSSAYILAAAIMAAGTIVVMVSQQHFVDRAYTAPDMRSAWQIIRTHPSLRRVATLNFLLQFFYAVMIIYSPLYLTTVMHYSWSTIGIIFTIMLTAFILLEYPLGKWSDTIGEKTLLIIGLIIATISTALFATLGAAATVITVTAVLFCTRVGISFFEVMTESYFFKQITDKDEGVIAIYRMMYPLAYIITPLFGWLLLLHGSYMTIFTVLAVFLFLGLLYSFRLKDIVTG